MSSGRQHLASGIGRRPGRGWLLVATLAGGGVRGPVRARGRPHLPGPGCPWSPISRGGRPRQHQRRPGPSPHARPSRRPNRRRGPPRRYRELPARVGRRRILLCGRQPGHGPSAPAGPSLGAPVDQRATPAGHIDIAAMGPSAIPLPTSRNQTMLIQMATTIAATAPSASPEALPMELARALGDPLRWRIMELLATEQLCVAHLAEELATAQPLVSHHLKVLREAGLIEPDRYRYWTYYRLRPGVLVRLGATLGLIARSAPSGTACRRLIPGADAAAPSSS